MDTTQPHQGAKVALFLGARLVGILRDDRPDIPFPGLWDLPGGGREGRETAFQTAARETREELGLTLTQADVLWQRDFPASTDPTRRSTFFVAALPAAAADRIVFGDEGQRWALFTLADFIGRKDCVPSYAGRLRCWLAEGGIVPDRDGAGQA